MSSVERAKRTILLNGSFGPSLVNFRGSLIRELVTRGYRVHVTAPDLSAGLEAELTALGATAHQIPLCRTGLHPQRDLAYCYALYRLIRHIRADYVIGYTIKPNIWGSIAAGCASVPSASMVTGLGFAFIEGEGTNRKLVQRIAHRLYRAATARNEHVVFQNPDDAADFLAAGCLADAGKIVMVDGSGVDTGHFVPAPLPDEPRFLLIARLLVSKGIREYAAAAAAVAAAFPDARFFLAGPTDKGPDALSPTELEDIRAAGVHYLGALDDVRPAIASSSIYVLPSYREGTPRTVLEAMAMGRPIITSDAPGCREAVVAGDNGLLVPPGDSAGLAEAMRMMAGDAELRKRMGAASRRIAVAKYEVNKVNSALLAGLGLFGAAAAETGGCAQAEVSLLPR